MTHVILAAARDESRGSSEVARTVRQAVGDALQAGRQVARLADLLLQASAERPELAALHDATAALLRIRDAREEPKAAWNAYGARLDGAEARCAARALEVLPDGPLIVGTHSRSGTVSALLEALHAESRLAGLVLTEAPPGFEGRAVARAWERRVPVVMLAEARIGEVAHRARIVAVGCDHVFPAEGRFVNKAGTRRLLAACQAAGVPALLVATRHKVSPVPLPVRPPFETVPLALVASLVTDAGPGMPPAADWPAELLEVLGQEP